MSNKQEDANLILRLYELRREETMRKARDWFLTEFNPENIEGLLAVMVGRDNAAYRMVSSYWDMAAAFVNHGAIDEQLFNDIHFEQIAVYAKIQPFLSDFRARTNAPYYLTHLEQLVRRMPDIEERLATLRRFMKRRLDAKNRAAAASPTTEPAAPTAPAPPVEPATPAEPAAPTEPGANA
ncbi:MAG: hypothetical protein QOD28_1809 [Acidobacteriota bacterium]|nr:hypothetical protein [Acidobacteriota bacterium]